MSFTKSLINTLFHRTLHVDRPEFRAILTKICNDAWIDNCEDKLYFAEGPARRIFNETIGAYVLEYWKRTGNFPEGHHDVLGNGRRTIYFAPLVSAARKRANVSTIRSPEGASA